MSEPSLSSGAMAPTHLRCGPGLRPRLLCADNLTPATRTPWGGHRIAQRYKAGLGLPREIPLGEAWEISVEPSFPSRLADSGRSLEAEIAGDPVGWLGPAVAARYGGELPLLVKILDAGADLSVQVHPAADDPDLAPGESGKPEAWIILEADPGSGIYLGFRQGVTRARVAAALESGQPLDALLNFVPVAPGQVYEVTAGTVHAIGAGVTLVEPQHVTPGLRGVTYRLWDWGRRYDEAGRQDPAGRPRPLHITRALAVTNWDAPRGQAFVDACRREPQRLDGAGGGLEGWHLMRNPYFSAERWCGTGRASLAMRELLGLVCIAGEARLNTAAGELRLPAGQSAVVPAACDRVDLEGMDLDLYVCRPVAGQGGAGAFET